MKLYQTIKPASDGELPGIQLDYTATTNIIIFAVEDITPTDFTIDLRSLAARPGSKDCTVYSVFDNGSMINLFSETLLSKQDPKQYILAEAAKRQSSRFLDIIIPDVSDVSTAVLRLVHESNRPVSITGDLDIQPLPLPELSSAFPEVTFGEVSVNGGLISIPVTATADVTMYFETTLGLLLTPTLDGSGTILIQTAGIPAGTTGKLKANFKYWSNVASCTFTI